MSAIDAPLESSAQCANCGTPLHAGKCSRCAFAAALAWKPVPAPATVDEPRLADLFPEYRFAEKIGRGGFGAVYRAEHRHLRRPLAVKLLSSQLTRSVAAVARFEREMAAVAQLDHPGIVRAHDAGERGGQWFIAMEFVEGADFAAVQRALGPLPVAEACEAVRQAAFALHHAHRRGLVHRDVKPGNLMLARDGSVKVLDFGLAIAASEDGAGYTATGEFLGTVDFIAPEMLHAPAAPDPRVDTYGLGATLHTLLAGTPPHGAGREGETLFQKLLRIGSNDPARLGELRDGLPRELLALVARLLSRDPAKRPASAAEVAKALAPFCNGADLAGLLARVQPGAPEWPHAGDTQPVFKTGRRSRTRQRMWWATALALVAGVTWWAGRGSQDAATPRPLLSPDAAAALAINVEDGPRLYSAEWQLERIISIGRHDPELRASRFLRDGSIVLPVSANSANPVNHIERRLPPDFAPPASYIETGAAPWTLDVAPDGRLVWGAHFSNESKWIGRAEATGKPLPSLGYAGDYRAGIMGFAFAGNDDAPLREGDIFIADAGMKENAGRGSLWRFRFDSDAPAERLGADTPLLTAPAGLAIAHGSIFILNRNAGYQPTAAITPADTTRRLIRWDGTEFRACTLSAPIRAPSGIAADPAGRGLFVAEGLDFTAGTAWQRVLLLHPGAGDTFTVEIIADHFGKLAATGLAFSADGRRMLIDDMGHGVVFVLRRK